MNYDRTFNFSNKDDNEVNSFASLDDFDYAELNKRLTNQYEGRFSNNGCMQIRRSRVCSNCRTRETSIWRWSEDKNNLLCNACGLYEKTHKKNRPVVISESGNPRILKKTEIFNNCVLCDAVITDILPEYKAFCFKCSRISDNIDPDSFSTFKVQIRDNTRFGSGGKFYKFRLYK